MNRIKIQLPWEDQWHMRGNQEIIPIWGPTFHVTTKLFQVTIRPLSPPPSWIKFIRNVLVGHVQGLFQIREGPFPFNSTIIMHGVPNDLTCFLNGPLQIIEHEIILLAPDNPWKITPQEKLDATKLFKCLA